MGDNGDDLHPLLSLGLGWLIFFAAMVVLAPPLNWLAGNGFVWVW